MSLELHRPDPDRPSSGAVDPRGFHYALEPLRRQRIWRLEALRQQLTQAQHQLIEQEQQLAQLKQTHGESSRALLRTSGARIEPSLHTRSLSFLVQLQQKIARQLQALATLRTQHEQLQQDYFRAHNNLDALNQHRELAVQAHASEQLRQQAVEADRDWLARSFSNAAGAAQEAWQ